MNPELKRHAITNYGPGLVTMLTCRLCGHLEWRSTDSRESDDVVVKDLSPHDHPCPRCTVAFARAPEVAEWVQGIALKLRRDLAPEAPTFDVEKILDAADELLRRRDYASSRDSPERRAVLEALIAALALDARAPRPRDLRHSPIATVDLSRITGCSCGWKVPTEASDSDTEFARHAAVARMLP